MPVCYIVGAGEFTDRAFTPTQHDFVIAADGGYEYIAGMGIVPDLLIGDFDSLSSLPDNVPVMRFPPEKDDTDMGLALSEGLKRGYKVFRIYGGGGGRLDHFIANLQLLNHVAKAGAEMVLVCRDFDVYAIYNSSQTFYRPAGTLLSVFAADGTAKGVTIKNAKYTLNDYTLTADTPLGVSNEILGGGATVEVKNGLVWAFVYM